MPKYGKTLFSLLASISMFIIQACHSTKLISKEELKTKNYQEVIGHINKNESGLDHFAMYPEGINGVYKRITKIAVCPSKNTSGVVIVEFTIGKNGSITDIKIIKSASVILDEEALGVISTLKGWYPAFKNGKPTRVI